MQNLKVAVVGGSIGGLSTAIAMMRLGATVRVFEKSSTEFTGRGGSLGFCDISLWQRLRGARMLRRGQQASRAQGAFIYGDLWQFWYDALPAGTVQFGVEVNDLGDDPASPRINGEQFDMVVVADGGWSQLRARYFDSSLPQYAGYEIWRFRIERKYVPNAAEGQYMSARGGPFMTIHLPVAMNDGRDFIMGGSSIAMPESELTMSRADLRSANRQAGADAFQFKVPDWFLPFYKLHFGVYENGEVYRTMEAAARHGKITPLPLYEFAASRVVNGRLVLIGDAAHMASPATAVGAHTAVLDAASLYDAFAQQIARGGDGLIDRALAAYSKPAIQRAADLLARSRQVSKPYSVPGWSYKDAPREVQRNDEL